ncbi:MAG: DUF6489 family protein [Oceanococcus sp.]
MQIKIEIDLKPEELRQFLGIPDVLGIQEDLLRYAKEKFSDGIDGVDPKSFVKENMDAVRGTKAWQKLIAAAFGSIDEDDTARKKGSRRRRSTSDDE